MARELASADKKTRKRSGVLYFSLYGKNIESYHNVKKRVVRY